MRILLLALDGLWDTGLTVMLNAFGLANKPRPCMSGTPHFDVSVVGVRCAPLRRELRCEPRYGDRLAEWPEESLSDGAGAGRQDLPRLGRDGSRSAIRGEPF